MTYDIFDADARTRWLKFQHPLTIIADRYGGTYSGGEFLALPLYFYEVPREIAGDDRTCITFWDENANDRLIPVGRGDTPQAAYEDLLKRLEPKTPTESAGEVTSLSHDEENDGTTNPA